VPHAEPFERHAGEYDDWFDRHTAAYVSELLALRPFVPLSGRGLEVGVGSGRFAAPLGIAVGLDPSHAMLERARERGVQVVEGVAERLPFPRHGFDYVVLVTTLCFVDSAEATLAEARRVLRPGGTLVIGFIDRDSSLGREYETRRASNDFYRRATFRSADEVERLLARAGFAVTSWAQTLCLPAHEASPIEPVRPGRGDGGFVVVRAQLDGSATGR
jgi:SAM-dependent methyltransferase